MGVNKVIYGGETVIDISDTDATSEAVEKGVTFYSASGEKATGTFTLEEELSAQDSLISQIQTALEGKAAGGGSGWIDVLSLPTTYAIIGETEKTYYLELPAGAVGIVCKFPIGTNVCTAMAAKNKTAWTTTGLIAEGVSVISITDDESAAAITVFTTQTDVKALIITA